MPFFGPEPFDTAEATYVRIDAKQIPESEAEAYHQRLASA
jgi:hypothetical protein